MIKEEYLRFYNSLPCQDYSPDRAFCLTLKLLFMIKKTIYFETPVYLSLQNGQMLIRLPEVENSMTITSNAKKEMRESRPIEDIGFVILDNRRITMTSGLLDALLGNNCAVITCDSRSMPSGLFLPLSGNSLQSERFRAQIDASLPLKKQLWQQTVRAKINNQASALALCCGKVHRCMTIWADDVKSGDSDNLEARAAAYYWKNVFPSIPGFVRQRDGVWPNALLNYGYAILRAVVARSLVSCGMLPTLGIHHHNRYNAYCLADDIMEPYRPYVDYLVLRIMETNLSGELDRETKAKLLSISTIEVNIDGCRRPLMVAVGQTTSSLQKCFSGEQRKIAYPVL